MALVTVSSVSGLDASSGMYAPQISDGLVAGEDIGSATQAITPCYIKGSDGKVYQADGTAANEKARLAGFAARYAKTGEPVTLFGIGTKFEYSTGLTPGALYYLGTTAGRLDTAATTGDAVGVAQAVTATMIRVTRGV
jgi:hypothetical protein